MEIVISLATKSRDPSANIQSHLGTLWDMEKPNNCHKCTLIGQERHERHLGDTPERG